MEGSINEDSSIAETNVISKATAVVSNPTAQLLKATSNGQKVAVLTTGPRASSSTINNGRSSSPQTNNNNNGRHHSNSSKSVPTVAQAIAVPGGMSIVQLLPNQTSNMVQSVIQPNHQSVIQAPNTTSLPLQLNNKLILVSNKGSVIQSTTDPHGEHHHQQHNNNIQLTGGGGGNASGNGKDGSSNDSGSAGGGGAGDTAAALSQAMAYAAADEEAKRRREGLARRPSYRKILNDLTDGGDKSTDDDDDEDDGVDDPHHQQRHPPTLTLPTSYLKVLPASIQIGGGGGQDGGQGGISTIMTSSGGGGGGNGSTILQYASAHDGQFIVPADLQTYQLSRHPGQNVVMTTSSSGSLTPQIIDEASKKRELRLLKNREAAKECRRKKKEYIKCLENRVAVLENQNKALIDELKTLKELYCKKSD